MWILILFIRNNKWNEIDFLYLTRRFLLLQTSVCDKPWLERPDSNGKYFDTHDQMYILKTIDTAEFEYFTNKLLRQYLQHITSIRKYMLVEYAGLYSSKSTGLMIMIVKNVFPNSGVDRIFELKGTETPRPVSKH